MILHKQDLSPSQREAIEQLLGRALNDEEAISLRPLSVEFLPELERTAAIDKLRALLRPGRPASPVSEQEFEEAYLEAMRGVRPGYTEVA